MKRKKLKVAVLMGGKSSEHDISILSGKEVIKNLDRNKYLPIPVIVSKKGTFKLPNNFDVAFIALHGPFGEDGSIQGLLEFQQIPYTGSGILASAIGMDKIVFRELMKAKGIAVPREVKKAPCFVKPFDQGSSIGASLVKKQSELSKAIKLAGSYSERVLIEEYVKGIEVTCSVLGSERPYPLPLIEIVPLKGEFFDYRSKYSESGADEIVPARISKSLTKKVQDLAVKVYEAVGCRGFARVDFILKNGKEPIVLEINTIPGLTPMSLLPKAAKAAGISYKGLLNKIINYAL